MKTLLILLFSALAANAQITGNIKLVWDYPSNHLSKDLLFEVYSSPIVTTPLPLWNNITNVVGTNTSVNLNITPGQQFFVVITSNFWGKSVYSNITNTPTLPGAITNLGVNKIP